MPVVDIDSKDICPLPSIRCQSEVEMQVGQLHSRYSEAVLPTEPLQKLVEKQLEQDFRNHLKRLASKECTTVPPWVYHSAQLPSPIGSDKSGEQRQEPEPQRRAYICNVGYQLLPGMYDGISRLSLSEESIERSHHFDRCPQFIPDTLMAGTSKDSPRDKPEGEDADETVGGAKPWILTRSTTERQLGESPSTSRPSSPRSGRSNKIENETTSDNFKVLEGEDLEGSNSNTTGNVFTLFPDLIQHYPDHSVVLDKRMSTSDVARTLAKIGKKADFSSMKQATRLIPPEMVWLEGVEEVSKETEAREEDEMSDEDDMEECVIDYDSQSKKSDV